MKCKSILWIIPCGLRTRRDGVSKAPVRFSSDRWAQHACLSASSIIIEYRCYIRDFGETGVRYALISYDLYRRAFFGGRAIGRLPNYWLLNTPRWRMGGEKTRAQSSTSLKRQPPPTLRNLTKIQGYLPDYAKKVPNLQMDFIIIHTWKSLLQRTRAFCDIQTPHVLIFPKVNGQLRADYLNWLTKR